MPIFGLIKVDGVTYNFLGKTELNKEYILPLASISKWESKYTYEKPSSEWNYIEYNDKNWETGNGAYGNGYYEYANTLWETNKIWIRKKFNLEKDFINEDVFLEYSHDDIFELYINGIQIIGTDYSWRENASRKLDERVKKTLREGENIITVYCQNITGGSLIDFGIYTINQDEINCDKEAEVIKNNILTTQIILT